MAGIGFMLRRSVARDGFLGAGGAYLSAAVISSGPWLISVASLVAISLFTTTLVPRERDVLFAAIMYAFAFSLIGVGLIQMTVTRYLADMVYLGKYETVGPSFVGTASVVLTALSIPIAALCFALTDLPILFRLAMLSVFVGAVGTWLGLIYLSVMRDYARIVRAFLFGYSLGGICALLAGPVYGSVGYLLGFALGQLLVFGCLASVILNAFQVHGAFTWHLGAFSYIKRYPSLVIIGFSYSLALWSDKLLFWFAPTGTELYQFLRVSPRYDVAVFLSSLVAVPASVVFLIQVETTFYERYRAFFDGIGGKRPLLYLREARLAMLDALRRSFVLLVKVQVVAVLVGLVLANGLYSALGLPMTDVVVFQNLVIATGVQVLLLISLLVLLYFDLRVAATVTSVTFLLANVALTLLTLRLGAPLHGLGYGGAALCALIVSQWHLWRYLAHLEFYTFTRQPIRS